MLPALSCIYGAVGRTCLVKGAGLPQLSAWTREMSSSNHTALVKALREKSGAPISDVKVRHACRSVLRCVLWPL